MHPVPLLHGDTYRKTDEQSDLIAVNFVVFKTLPDSEPIVVQGDHRPLNTVITFDGLF